MSSRLRQAVEELSLFCFSFLIRFLFFWRQPFEDPSWSPHWNLSTGLLKFRTLGYSGERITDMEPGYPFFLAVARFLSGDQYVPVMLAQMAVASLGCVFLYRMGLVLGEGDHRVGRMAALLFAIYPYLIGQASKIIEVPLFTTLLMAVAWTFLKPSSGANSLLCGFFMGLTLLTRTMIFPAFALGCLGLLFQRRFRDFLLISLTAGLIAGPWFFRSHAVDGTWVPPRGGWNFLQGNCPYSDKIIPRYNPDLLDAYVDQLIDRTHPEWTDANRPTLARDMDRFFSQQAWEFIRTHPWRTLRLKALNILYLYHPRIVPFESMDAKTRIRFTGEETFIVENVPRRGLFKEVSHTLAYSFIFLTGLAGIYLRRKQYRSDFLLFLILLNFTVVYVLCWPATRLRAPADFIFMFFSAFLILRLKDHFFPARRSLV